MKSVDNILFDFNKHILFAVGRSIVELEKFVKKFYYISMRRDVNKLIPKYEGKNDEKLEKIFGRFGVETNKYIEIVSAVRAYAERRVEILYGDEKTFLVLDDKNHMKWYMYFESI